MRNLKYILGGIGLAAGALTLGGCYGGQPGALSPRGEANVQNLGAQLISTGANTVISEAVQSQFPENRPQINVYNQAQVPQTIPVIGATPQKRPEIVTYNKWVDLNSNRRVEWPPELFGFNKDTFYIDKEDVHVNVFTFDYAGRIVFRSWKEDGTLIGENTVNVGRSSFGGGFTGLNSPLQQGDYMDNIKFNGKGRYAITANLDDGTVLRKDINLK